jgi:cytidyltransferase-like protein
VIVLANGCFDPFHWGHLKHLQAASKMGDMLYVSVTADAFVNKGPGRPVFTDKQRAEVIRALECVHGVLIVENSLEALKNIMPDIFVKGKEYRGKISPQDLAFCKEHDIQIRFTDEPVYSSTALLNHERK